MSKWRIKGVKEGNITCKIVAVTPCTRKHHILLMFSRYRFWTTPSCLTIQRNLTKFKCICLKCVNVLIKCSRNHTQNLAQCFPIEHKRKFSTHKDRRDAVMLACAVSGPSDKQESVRYSNLFLSISRLLFVCHIVISLHKTSSSVCVDSSVFRHNTKTTSSRRPRRDCAFFTPVLFHANIKPVQRTLSSCRSSAAGTLQQCGNTLGSVPR